MTRKLLVLIALVAFVSVVNCYDWTKVNAILESGITNRAFPGVTALVADKTGILFMTAKGHFTYDSSSPSYSTQQTLFDMASVTKVLSTTSAVALLYQQGVLPLSTKVSQILPEFAQNGKENVTVENCLLHNAGLKPDPVPNYNLVAFGCPESFKYHPQLSFSCMSQVFNATMAQPLDNPPGAVFKYSDLSMITLMYVVGRIAKNQQYVTEADLNADCAQGMKTQPFGHEQCYYEAFVRKNVFQKLKMNSSGFATTPKPKNVCPPGWNETLLYRHEILQGIVSDENAYAMGGIAGHAGLFSTLTDVYSILRTLMFPAPVYDTTPFLTAETMQVFTTAKNLTQSSRALGWDTNRGNSSGGTLSPSTYQHLGYSGTGVWSDPERKLISIFLSNRCYPEKLNGKYWEVMKAYNTAVQEAYDAHE